MFTRWTFTLNLCINQTSVKDWWHHQIKMSYFVLFLVFIVIINLYVWAIKLYSHMFEFDFVLRSKYQHFRKVFFINLWFLCIRAKYKTSEWASHQSWQVSMWPAFISFQLFIGTHGELYILHCLNRKANLNETSCKNWIGTKAFETPKKCIEWQNPKIPTTTAFSMSTEKRKKVIRWLLKMIKFLNSLEISVFNSLFNCYMGLVANDFVYDKW